MTRWGHVAVYAGEWIALFLAWTQFNRSRPKKGLHQSYWILAGVLILLQIYGESWHR